MIDRYTTGVWHITWILYYMGPSFTWLFQFPEEGGMFPVIPQGNISIQLEADFLIISKNFEVKAR
jgi:hypothetical protein